MKNLIGFIGVLVLYALVNPLPKPFNGFSYLYSCLIVSFWWCLIALSSTVASMKVILFNSFLSFMSLYVYTRGINPVIDKDILLLFSAIFGVLSYLSILSLKNNSKPYLILNYLFYATISIIIVAIYINVQVNGFITKDAVYAIMQSNAGESINFLLDNLNYKGIILPLFFVLILGFFFNKVRNFDFELVDVKVKILVILSLLLTIFTSYEKNTLSDIRKIKGYIDDYNIEIGKWRAVKEKRNLTRFNAEALKNGQLHVVVIGESLASYHLSSYGYPALTTPWIDSSDKIKLSQAYSNHTHTMPVLSLALTQANQYNGMNYYESASIIDVAQKAGFEVSWISSQVKVGAWDNLVSVLADTADTSKFINTSSIGTTTSVKHKDKALIPHIKKQISNLDLNNNNLIIIHTMGSHGSYCARVKGETMKIDNLSKGYFNNKNNHCYDNSVKYTDEFLQEVYNELTQIESF